MEIYNEEIRDLLTTDNTLKYDIKMSDSKGTDIHVTNLKVEEVTSEGQIASMIRRARKNRAQAKTLCNERSSRFVRPGIVGRIYFVLVQVTFSVYVENRRIQHSYYRDLLRDSQLGMLLLVV